MPKTRRIILRPTFPGICVATLPLILLHPKIGGSGVSALFIGIGIPALVIFSLLFLLAAIPFLIQSVKKVEHQAPTLVSTRRIGEYFTLEANPQRPKFLPGTRLYFCWEFTFGSFREKATIPLPSMGKGELSWAFPRRGEWMGHPSFLASDPFGFFILKHNINADTCVSVPPKITNLTANIPGTGLSAQSAINYRLNESVEEKMEQRHYVPGDDPRHIDWRHYAQTGELFIQVGEDPIPTHSEIWIQVIASPNRSIKKAYQQLDESLSWVYTIVHKLTGRKIILRFPGEKSWLDSDKEGWLERIARVHPSQCEYHSIINETPKNAETFYCVSHPSDEEAQKIFRQATSDSRRIIFFFPGKDE